MMPSIETLLGEALSFTYPPDDLLETLPPPMRARRANDLVQPDPKKKGRRRG